MKNISSQPTLPCAQELNVTILCDNVKLVDEFDKKRHPSARTREVAAASSAHEPRGSVIKLPLVYLAYLDRSLLLLAG